MTPRALPALLLLAAPVQAQPGPNAQEAVRRFLLERLKDRVGLSDAQAQKVVDRWQRFNQEHTSRQQDIAHLRQRFQDILLSPVAEDQKNARIKPLLEQFLDLRRQQLESKQRFEDDIRADLSPAQQARLVVTIDEFINQLVKALENRPALRGLREGQEEGRPRRRFQ